MCLERSERNGNKYEKKGILIEEAQMGLLSNIHDIVKNTFFLENPLGEFSNVYFSNILEQINELNKDNEKRIRKIIDDIDEPVLHAFLNKQYNEKIRKIFKEDELIKYYEKQLEKLKGKK